MGKLPVDYAERVYAGVLGKLIGVYLGRPFEQWSHERIKQDLGEIRYYVHEKLGVPLVVTDDDISGTFTFVRALEDFGYDPELPAAAIGRTWLNYIIENKTILWWGGMGVSTEDTAFQRLKRGIDAPRSGSIELNGQVVAEQIGSQIFIDGWALVCPGDPERAAALAANAASVSHDGEALHGAVLLAAMEAQAFVEPDMDKLLETGYRFIPKDCTIRKLTDEIRGWREQDRDWERSLRRIQEKYGYEKFGGGCHMVPNHAIIQLALAYAPDDFQQSLLIANTAGYDTDCNSGNVGCLLGIKDGLKSLEAGPDWRGPVADRLYLPTADGGRCVSDAVRETYELVKAGCALAGEPYAPPKDGARYHFELPGSVQGWRFEESADCRCIGTVWNAAGHSARGARSLAIGYHRLAFGRAARAAVDTFLSPEAAKMPGYSLIASPALYPGQTVRAAVEADAHNDRPVTVRPYVRYYGEKDAPAYARGPETLLAPGQKHAFEWKIPDAAVGPRPIAQAGIEIVSAEPAAGSVYLDYFTWAGAPDLTFGDPGDGGKLWQSAWVTACDTPAFGRGKWPFGVFQDDANGLLSIGTREWRDYRVDAVTHPHLCDQAGIACGVQGLQRYYALVLARPNKLRLIKQRYGRSVVAEKEWTWTLGQEVRLALEFRGPKLSGFADGRKVLEAEDRDAPFTSGGIGLLCDAGRTGWGPVRVQPV
ncbi:MAG: hypothetical protein AMXMBFR7_14900 [Planctomycetota bacterium]